MIKSSYPDDILVVGKQTFHKQEVFDHTGHFREKFYRNEISKFYDRHSTILEHIRIYKKFRDRYPTLDMWFQDDLIARVGRTSIDQDRSYETRVNYRSRWYIYHLCIFGLSLDYPYLFSIRAMDGFSRTCKRYGLNYGIADLQRTIKDLKYHEHGSFTEVKWVFNRILMHTSKKSYTEITIEDLTKFEEESRLYCLKENLPTFWRHTTSPNIHKRVKSSLYKLHLVLYGLGVFSTAPKRHYIRDDFVTRDLSHLKHGEIAYAITQYVQQISLTKERSTLDKVFKILHRFAQWLELKYPFITNLNQLTRDAMDSYLNYLQSHISTRTGKKYSTSYICNYISILKVFFDESLIFGFQDVPQYKLLFNYHLPKKPKIIPRYIREQDLAKLMQAIRALGCPYQRNALILLRWTGARREEIRRLDINALDFYQDGTPKLYIPIGKTNTSRWVPIQKEAEDAFKELLEIRESAGNLRGLTDRKTGKLTDYLFMKKNYMLSSPHLFDYSMREACKQSGLLTETGKQKYTSHQFRHTIGTQMANRGASLATIMKMLGHLSPDMTIRYTYIHDETLKKDYQNSIDKDIIIAGGEYAKQIKRQSLQQKEIDWIKNNFHKTYLIMGHCFHHTRESMCDFADACYFCPKFVTTREHLPRLMEKHSIEIQLIEDAEKKGWQKEIDRHTNVSQRVRQIIRDLGGAVESDIKNT